MLKRLTIIAAMLALFTLLAAPLVLAQQEEGSGVGEAKVGSNVPPPPDSGVDSPYAGLEPLPSCDPELTQFLQYNLDVNIVSQPVGMPPDPATAECFRDLITGEIVRRSPDGFLPPRP